MLTFLFPGSMIGIPKESLEDVCEAFSKITFLEGLKESRRVEYKEFGKMLEDIGREMRIALEKGNSGFGYVPERYFCNVGLDSSMTSRTEFSVSCSSNQTLVYVGDAYLQLFIASACFKRNKVPKDHQTNVQKFVSNKYLSTVFDKLLPNIEPLRWKDSKVGKATPKQKAQCLEALIGMLYVIGMNELADWVCSKIVEIE